MKNQRTTKKAPKIIFTLVFIVALIMSGCAALPQEVIISSAPASAPAELPQTPETAAPSAAQTQAADILQVSYVSLDVNPSIQLAIKGGVVIGVEAFNDDGAAIVLSCDVIGLDYTDAVNQLIGALATDGYLAPENEPALVITAYGHDVDVILPAIETQAQQSLTDLGLVCDVVASNVSDEIAQIAKDNDLTPGRYMLIKFMADNDGITLAEAIEKYSDYKMGELTQLVGQLSGVYDDLDTFFEGLTEEQLAALSAAQSDFEAAMHAAVEANRAAKDAAIEAFHQAKDAAELAYDASDDKSAWQAVKEAARDQFHAAMKTAKDAFASAKTQAKETLLAALAGLGIDAATIDKILAWDYDTAWDFDFAWGHDGAEDIGEGEKPDDVQDNGENGKPGDDDEGDVNDEDRPEGTNPPAGNPHGNDDTESGASGQKPDKGDRENSHSK